MGHLIVRGRRFDCNVPVCKATAGPLLAGLAGEKDGIRPHNISEPQPRNCLLACARKTSFGRAIGGRRLRAAARPRPPCRISRLQGSAHFRMLLPFGSFDSSFVVGCLLRRVDFGVNSWHTQLPVPVITRFSLTEIVAQCKFCWTRQRRMARSAALVSLNVVIRARNFVISVQHLRCLLPIPTGSA